MALSPKIYDAIEAKQVLFFESAPKFSIDTRVNTPTVVFDILSQWRCFDDSDGSVSNVKPMIEIKIATCIAISNARPAVVVGESTTSLKPAFNFVCDFNFRSLAGCLLLNERNLAEFP